MNKVIHFLFWFLLIGNIGFSQNNLSENDIVVLQVNADGGGDSLALLVLVDIPENEVFYISDISWNALTSSYSSATERGVKMTVAAGGMSAGTIIRIDNPTGYLYELENPVLGTLEFFQVDGAIETGTSRELTMSTAGDQLAIFQTTDGVITSDKTFIYSFNYYASTNYPYTTTYGWRHSDSTLSSTSGDSHVPPGLTPLNSTQSNKTTASAFGIAGLSGGHVDNWQYTGPVTAGDKDSWVTRIHTLSNWSSNDVTPFTNNTIANGGNVVVAAQTTPTTQASNVGFSNTTASGTTIDWTNGNGEKCVVFIKTASTGAASPENSTTYTANTTFGSGTEIATSTGWYCVYNGTGESVSVSGLSAVTTYRVHVCEYNGSTGYELYLTDEGTNNPANLLTNSATAPTVTTQPVSTIGITTATGNGNITNYGGTNVSERGIYYSTTDGFANGAGTKVSTTGNWSANGAFTQGITGLTANTTYYVKAFAINSEGTGYGSQVSFITIDFPSTQASNVGFSSTSATETTIEWTRGDGANCAVFMKATTTGTASPANSTTYTANIAFGSGTEIATSTGWYCVYNGIGTSVSVTGLSEETEYRIHVCEYNGSTGSEFYLSDAGIDNPNNVTTSPLGVKFVDLTATGTNNGTSWTNAYTSLQSAIDVAVSGDEIWVAKGTYYPSQETDGTTDTQRKYSFQMVDDVEIYGGFAGTESATTERTDYGYGETNETILSGDFNNDDVITGSGSTLSISGNSENCYHIFDHPIGYTLTSSALLGGFTLKGGYASGSANPYNDGGAIYNQNGQSPTINNCYFIGNEVADNGGAIVNAYSANATITNCTFTKNMSGVGMEGGGGAIFNHDNSNAEITNCLFVGNRVAGGTNDLGGAIYNNEESDATITNCTFVENYAKSGGGIYNNNNSDPTITNCIIWGNTINGGVGSQVRNYDGSGPTFTNCDIEGGWDGSGVANNSSTPVDGGGNINSDPEFVGSTLNSSHPYSILGDSPCADVGSDAANSETFDIRGSDYGRKLDKDDGTSGIIDIGAYEYDYNQDWSGANIIYVNDNASGDDDGSHWGDAYVSLQDALDHASADDQIWVAAGTYKPETEVGGVGDRYKSFQMINNVEIYGGFNMTEHAPGARTDYRLGGANESILSGDIGTQDDDSDNCYHVFNHPPGTDLDNTAFIDGFTITKGNADHGSDYLYQGGGGMYTDDCSQTINNCIFTYNCTTTTSFGKGGAIIFQSSTDDPVLSNCTFANNSSYNGGAIYNSNTNQSLSNCTFTNNTATYMGGALFSYAGFTISDCDFTGNSSANYAAVFAIRGSSNTTITNCTMSNNSGSSYGGAIWHNGGHLDLVNCLIIGNSSTTRGGALYSNSSGGVDIVNCTFAVNTTGSFGGTVYYYTSSPGTIKNTVIYGNSSSSPNASQDLYAHSGVTISNCNVWGSGGSSNWTGGYYGTDGGNNIDTDPRFVGSTLNADHPYSLFQYSPCTDVGDDDAISESYDIRGHGFDRELNKSTGASGTVDMGCYEYLSGSDPSSIRTLTWDGSNDEDWSDNFNWNLDGIPALPANQDNVIIADVTNDPVVTTDASANCNNLTINSGAILTLESTSSGTGSLIINGNVTNNGTITAERYATAGCWHGISSPLTGNTANSYYLNGNPDVWLKEHNEGPNTYTYLTSLTTPLTDMKGFFMWIEGTAPKTFEYVGGLNVDEVGSDNNMVRSASGTENGWNFVGNPFTSAIDWDAVSGWSKSNLDNTIYVYNSTLSTWMTWNGSTGTNGGSQYVASGQGFFVSVSEGQSQGTLKMDDDVKVHNNVPYYKQPTNVLDNLIRLEVSSGNLKDETIIHLSENATTGFDSDFDAYKLFSFNTDVPQIYSTIPTNMAVVGLPIATSDIPVDVRGTDNAQMSISLTENNGFGSVYLVDNYLGTQTNLLNDDYDFVYEVEVTDRFIINFTITDVENYVACGYKIYSYNKEIKVVIPDSETAEIYIYNLSGQTIFHSKGHQGLNRITIEKTGQYIVKVVGNSSVTTKKVFIN